MKHLLNNLSQEEKDSILEQHKGGMKIFNENFQKMVNKKLGHVDLFEQGERVGGEGEDFRRKNGIQLPTINSQQELDRFISFERPDLAYQALTGNEADKDSEIVQRFEMVLRDLMTFIAQKCNKPNFCNEWSVQDGGYIDIFLKNKKPTLDELSIDITYPGEFKKYMEKQIGGKATRTT